jgi:hypothetical protein
MNSNFLILLLCFMLFSCGNDDEPNIENSPPAVPVQVYPSNNLLCIDHNVKFEWEPSLDIDGDPVKFELQVSKEEHFTNIAYHENNIIGTSKNLNLEKGNIFFWRVRAVDSQNAMSGYSSIYRFYTEGDGEINQLPFLPELISPKSNISIESPSVQLEWSATDADGNDLLFDIYVGTSVSTLELLSENQMASSFKLDVDGSKDYFWKVIVKDNFGSTTGPIWQFKTK